MSYRFTWCWSSENFIQIFKLRACMHTHMYNIIFTCIRYYCHLSDCTRIFLRLDSLDVFKHAVPMACNYLCHKQYLECHSMNLLTFSSSGTVRQDSWYCWWYFRFHVMHVNVWGKILFLNYWLLINPHHL